LNFEIV